MPTIGREEYERLIRGFMSSRVILTAIELDMFTAVGDGGGAEDVARRAGVAPRGAEMLLNVLVAFGMLEKSGGRFRLNDFSAQFLCDGAPRDERLGVAHLINLWPRWSALTDCVRTGTRVAPDEERLDTASFIGAMHAYHAETAPAAIAPLDLDGVTRVLDVGGGSGAYAIAFAKAKPDLEVTVFDLPEVTPLTEQYVAKAGQSERVRTRSGDMTTDDLGADYDLVWIAAVCHMFSPEEVAALFAKAHASLRSGGRIAVNDFFLDEDKTSPRFGALFALNMLVNTPGGSSYSEAEYTDWLQVAGFKNVRRLDPLGVGDMIVADRP